MGERTYADDGPAHVGPAPERQIDPAAGRDGGPRWLVDDNDAHAGVARRLQARLDRQLWLLGRMESDPLQPAPPALPELLDMARRMRRDTESILLLVGREPGVRQEQASSLGGLLSDAAAAAEEPRRIVVRQVPAAAVRPGAATELMHVLAELLDHATAIYPGADISVAARIEGSGGLTVEVRADGGARHDPDALGARRALDAAERLAQRSRSGVALHRELGGDDLIASVTCPSSAVVVEQLLRPVPSLPSSLRPSLGRSAGARPTPAGSADAGPARDPASSAGPGTAGPGTAGPGTAWPNGTGANGTGANGTGANGTGANGTGPTNGHGSTNGNGNGVRRLGELPSRPFQVEQPSGPATELDVVARAAPDLVKDAGAELPKRAVPSTSGSAPELPKRSRGTDGEQGPTLEKRPGTRAEDEFDSAFGLSAAAGRTPQAPSALDMPFSDKLFTDKVFAEESFGERPFSDLLRPEVSRRGEPAPSPPAPSPLAPSRPEQSFTEALPVLDAGRGGSSRPGRIDELFGPIADIPFDPSSAPTSTPIFEAIASAWFQHGNGPTVSSTTDDTDAQDWETPIDSEWRAAAERASRAEESPLLPTGLPRRTPGNQLVPPPRSRSDEPAQRPERVPDRIRERLSGYQRGLEQGRHRAEAAPARAEPGDPEFW